MPVASFSGAGTEIVFNGKYVLDCLGAFATDTVRLRLQDGPLKPCLVDRGDDAEQCSVLMPMKIL